MRERRSGLFGLWRWVLGAGALGLCAVFVLSLLGPVWFPLDIIAHFRLQIGALAIAGAALALLSGLWRLSALGLALAGGAALSLGPVWESPTRAAAPGCESAPFRVAVANILYHNHEPEAVIDALLALDADLLATLETVPRFSDPASRLHARYPHHSLSPQRGGEVGFYTMLWSKRPLIAADDGGGGDDAPNFAMADVMVSGRRVTVLGAHFSWPLVRQEPQLDGLAALLEGAAPLRVVMGDFNAAPWSEALRRAEAASGTRLAGGLRLSWRGRVPPGLPMPPGLALDHILASPGIGIERIGRAPIPASDHKAIVADLRIPLC